METLIKIQALRKELKARMQCYEILEDAVKRVNEITKQIDQLLEFKTLKCTFVKQSGYQTCIPMISHVCNIGYDWYQINLVDWRQFPKSLKHCLVKEPKLNYRNNSGQIWQSVENGEPIYRLPYNQPHGTFTRNGDNYICEYKHNQAPHESPLKVWIKIPQTKLGHPSDPVHSLTTFLSKNMIEHVIVDWTITSKATAICCDQYEGTILVSMKV